MRQRRDTYTRWAIIAAGEGGGRIASQYFDRDANPGIDDRVVVMNTNRADIRNTVRRLEESIGDAESEPSIGDHAILFGSDEGAGNVFAEGERLAAEDLEKIVRGIGDAIPEAEAFMHVATLGGGTGNGSIPYLIRQFKAGIESEMKDQWMDDVVHVATGAWPYEDEPQQQHFNAICGLSRLLRTPDGRQNADMVVLGDNTHLAQRADEDGNGTPDRDPNTVVNEHLVAAFDLMISAGRETEGVIDVKDYVSVPSQIGAYHFTPGVARNMSASVLDLEYMFEKAAKQTFVPIDVATVQTAFAVVRVPRRLFGSDEFSETAVSSAFDAWKRDRGIDVPGMSTVSLNERERDGVDVLLLLGGFDLEPLLERSRDDFETHKAQMERGRRLGNAPLSADELRRIEENLDEYCRWLDE